MAASIPTTGARPPIVRADDPHDRTPVRRLEFVEVRSASVEARPAPAATRRAVRRHKSSAPGLAGADDTASVPSSPGVPASTATPAWSLWGDAET